MAAQILIQLKERPRFVSQRVLIEGRLKSDKARRQVWIKREIDGLGFPESARRNRRKRPCLHKNRSPEIGGRVPTIEKGRATRGTRNVIGVEDGVPEKRGDPSVPIIGAAARNRRLMMLPDA